MTLRQMLLPFSIAHACPAVPLCRDEAVEARGHVCKPWARAVSRTGTSQLSTPGFCLRGWKGAEPNVFLCHRLLMFSGPSGIWDPSVTPCRSAWSTCSCQRGWDDTFLSLLSFAILTLLNKTRAQMHLVMHVLFFPPCFYGARLGQCPQLQHSGAAGSAQPCKAALWWWSGSETRAKQGTWDSGRADAAVSGTAPVLHRAASLVHVQTEGSVFFFLPAA